MNIWWLGWGGGWGGRWTAIFNSTNIIYLPTWFRASTIMTTSDSESCSIHCLTMLTKVMKEESSVGRSSSLKSIDTVNNSKETYCIHFNLIPSLQSSWIGERRCSTVVPCTLIRPDNLPRKCGHIGEVAFDERKNTAKVPVVVAKQLWPLYGVAT